MKQSIEADERLARIESNAKRFRVPRMRLHPDNNDTLAVCGFSPSLRETWRDADCDAVMTCSGAHDFLIERGVIPTYHAELDPREHKVSFVRNSHKGTQYFIAAHCHPKMFATLKNRDVTMYYAFTADDKQRQKEQCARLEGVGQGMFYGRSNAGMLAISIGRALGYRKFDLHGMDCCYPDGEIWAGKHTGTPHGKVTIKVDGREFITSNLMMESTDDFFRSLLVMPNVTFNIHGDGLLRARLKLYKRDPQLALSKDWWKPVDFELKKPDFFNGLGNLGFNSWAYDK